MKGIVKLFASNSNGLLKIYSNGGHKFVSDAENELKKKKKELRNAVTLHIAMKRSLRVVASAT